MPRDNRYILEKLRDTIYFLANGPGDARERLKNTYRIFHVLQVEDFPEEYQEDWKWILQQLTKFGPLMIGDKVFWGSVEHTMSRIRKRTGSKIAERIFKIYSGMSHDQRYNL